MLKLHKSIVQRRTALNMIGISSRDHIYFKVSLLLLSWGVIFVLISLINRGINYRVYADVLAVADDSDRLTTPVDSCTNSVGDEALTLTKAISTYDYDINESPESHTIRQAQEAYIEEDYSGDDSGSVMPSSSEELQARETPNLNVKTDAIVPSQKNGKISRVAPGLDEFKNNAYIAKERSTSRQIGRVVHRVEPSGIEYNYASSSKGAKVISFNKEAKGASNILDKDKDKYLRNPCSAEEKFVIIELSEETLVDSFEIANFEHYSSNLKDFELLSSLVYPTDSWVILGNFTLQNFKHAQRFVLPEPKWARYLKLNQLSHYGSEFYCTLSMVEVYGVDAVERMLEDLISVESKKLEPEEQILEQIPVQESEDDDMYHDLLADVDYEIKNESPKSKQEASRTSTLDPESRPLLVGRIPGDTVLKILMQKVQFLDANFSILERYLEELNTRYGHIFKELEDDIGKKESLLEKVGLEINYLQKDRDILANEIKDLLLWKFMVISEMDHLVKQSDALRLELEVIRNQHADAENRRIFVIFICFMLGCIAVCKLFLNLLFFVCRIHNSGKFCRYSAWLILLLSSTVIIFILIV